MFINESRINPSVRYKCLSFCDPKQLHRIRRVNKFCCSIFSSKNDDRNFEWPKGVEASWALWHENERARIEKLTLIFGRYSYHELQIHLNAYGVSDLHAYIGKWPVINEGKSSLYRDFIDSLKLDKIELHRLINADGTFKRTNDVVKMTRGKHVLHLICRDSVLAASVNDRAPFDEAIKSYLKYYRIPRESIDKAKEMAAKNTYS